MRKVAEVVGLTCPLLLVATYTPAVAQGWPPWADEAFDSRRSEYESFRHRGEPERPNPKSDERGSRFLRSDGSAWRSRSRNERGSPNTMPKATPSEVTGGDIRDGGPRPEIAAKAPSVVAFPYDFPAQSIVIDTGGRKLYFVLGDSSAYEYRIAVGREGFNWAGAETISRKQAWPDWHPPEEMRQRDPSLPEKMMGGVKNPLGAMALYLGTTLYRIHGTNDVKSIGRAESSGCFRMLNSAILHLASLAEIGTTVSVVQSLPAPNQVSRAAEPPPANLPTAQGARPSQTQAEPSARGP